MFSIATPTRTPTLATAKRTYRAAVITGPCQVEVREFPLTEPPAGTVRVRVTQCGVCSSNVPPWEGRPWFSYPLAPGALGHESIGFIESLGDGVVDWEVGDEVAYIGERGFAEMEIVSADALYRLPTGMGANVFLAEPLSCAMNVFRRAGIRRGGFVAIVGAGFLGTILVQLAVAAGARVLAVGQRAGSLEIARTFGAEPLVFADHDSAIQRVADLSEGRMCDVVIEATGHQDPLDLAAKLTKIRGRLVIAGYHEDGMRSINLQLWNWRGLDVINAHERDTEIYLEGMRLAETAMRERRITTRGLITHRYPLEELGAALTAAAERPSGFLKAMIEP